MICNSALIRDELDADEARERFRIAEGRGEAALATWARQWGGALMDACYGDAWQSMVSDLEEAGKEVRDTLDAWEQDTLAAAALKAETLAVESRRRAGIRDQRREALIASGAIKLTFSQWMRRRFPDQSTWVVAKKTKRVVERYGEDAVYLTPAHYESLNAQWLSDHDDAVLKRLLS